MRRYVIISFYVFNIYTHLAFLRDWKFIDKIKVKSQILAKTECCLDKIFLIQPSTSSVDQYREGVGSVDYSTQVFTMRHHQEEAASNLINWNLTSSILEIFSNSKLWAV